MKTLIINDLHLGVQRQAGTTKESRLALENWMLQRFKYLLEMPHHRLIILGDLFDQRNVDEHIMKEVIDILNGERCVLVLGNHDLQGGAEDHKMSSAEFVGMIGGHDIIDTACLLDGFYIIPHLHDQAEFDRAVSQCPDNTMMLTHCNIDSPWTHGDHSLNLSLAQIDDLYKRGIHVIAAHEHAQRDYMYNVTVIGNQFPSSIADCQSGPKRCLIVEGKSFTSVPTWDATDYTTGIRASYHKFIEVTGEVEIAEYTGIVKKVSELRRNSDAFIIKNSVKVKEREVVKVDQEVTHFNIIEMLMDAIPEKIRGEVKLCI